MDFDPTQPGPGLDRAVIERVFGWPVLEANQWAEDDPYPHAQWQRPLAGMPGWWEVKRDADDDPHPFAPSRDVRDAWEVFGWLVEHCDVVEITTEAQHFRIDGRVLVRTGRWPGEPGSHLVRGPMPLAVCQAALLVTGAGTLEELRPRGREERDDAAE